MPRTIKHQITLQQPPELVWPYLTESDLLAQWLMPNTFQLALGHQFQFYAKPNPILGFDGIIHGEVLEIEPLKKLVYSWKGGLANQKPALDSQVIWTLMPTDTGTLLQLEHTGFKGGINYLAYLVMNKGWEKIAQRLVNQVSLVTDGNTQA